MLLKISHTRCSFFLYVHMCAYYAIPNSFFSLEVSNKQMLELHFLRLFLELAGHEQ